MAAVPEISVVADDSCSLMAKYAKKIPKRNTTICVHSLSGKPRLNARMLSAMLSRRGRARRKSSRIENFLNPGINIKSKGGRLVFNMW